VEVNIPEPNPALTALLIGPRMQAIVLERAEVAKALYQAQVAKRTGRLAASAHADTHVGGARHDRHVGTLTVGEGLAYGAAHQFGHSQDEAHLFGSTHEPGQSYTFAEGSHDLNRVLEELGHA
jgi:hypothetical protein